MFNNKLPAADNDTLTLAVPGDVASWDPSANSSQPLPIHKSVLDTPRESRHREEAWLANSFPERRSCASSKDARLYAEKDRLRFKAAMSTATPD